VVKVVKGATIRAPAKEPEPTRHREPEYVGDAEAPAAHVQGAVWTSASEAPTEQVLRKRAWDHWHQHQKDEDVAARAPLPKAEEKTPAVMFAQDARFRADKAYKQEALHPKDELVSLFKRKGAMVRHLLCRVP
jgi:hypothetical protein